MGNVLLRLPPDIHELAKAAAKSEDRSLHQWLLRAIQATLLRRTERKEEPQ